MGHALHIASKPKEALEFSVFRRGFYFLSAVGLQDGEGGMKRTCPVSGVRSTWWLCPQDRLEKAGIQPANPWVRGAKTTGKGMFLSEKGSVFKPQHTITNYGRDDWGYMVGFGRDPLRKNVEEAKVFSDRWLLLWFLKDAPRVKSR